MLFYYLNALLLADVCRARLNKKFTDRLLKNGLRKSSWRITDNAASSTPYYSFMRFCLRNK
ncbi:hypothetical protein BG55_12575 [Erwinia mallotivora]|uniref:Uncharacterized protein n=1 Tax=Erwinia mallotivora TaxID=69222 RepID=A0A014N7C5_9GAMM|nr:hypothetical protein BG55_12575 [Erwinia mallotivora]